MIQWDCTVTWVLPSWKHQGGTQDHGKMTLEKGAKISCCNSLGAYNLAIGHISDI